MNQEALEHKYSKRHLVSLLTKEIKIDWVSSMVYSIEEYMAKTYSYESKNIRVSKLGDSLDLAHSIVLAILKLQGKIGTVQQVANSIAQNINDAEIGAVTTAVELLAVCEDPNVFELLAHNYSGNPTGTLAVEPKIHPSYETLELIEQFMYVPPCLEKPRWSANDKGGLQTVKDSAILGRQNFHHEFQALDALNLLQDIAWEIDPKMVCMREKPNKPLDTPDKFKQFATLRNSSKKVYNEYADRKFYFIWKFDKRGRMYSSGYHINLQSTDYKKALLNFAKKETITIGEIA